LPKPAAARCQLQGVVRDLERAALEAGRRVAGLSLAAAAQRRGPEPSPAEVAEALQDAWWAARKRGMHQGTAVEAPHQHGLS
jgi:hypothetical protein